MHVVNLEGNFVEVQKDDVIINPTKHGIDKTAHLSLANEILDELFSQNMTFIDSIEIQIRW
jgi:CO dehydrogenase/acetyl-CoA synthase beta subunit